VHGDGVAPVAAKSVSGSHPIQGISCLQQRCHDCACQNAIQNAKEMRHSKGWWRLYLCLAWKACGLWCVPPTKLDRCVVSLPVQNDRFIPNRAAMDFDVSHYAMTNENAGALNAEEDDDSKAAMKKTLASNMLGEDAASTGVRVLAFSEKAPSAPEGYVNSMKVLYSQGQGETVRKAKSTRYIPSAPERILDAPDLVDDFYLNLLDWSSSNVLAVALGQTVYLWNAATGGIEELCETKTADDFVTSVSWVKSGAGEHLAIGTNLAEVQLWDVTKQKQVSVCGCELCTVQACKPFCFVCSSCVA
jgi:hypothetical protein